MAQPFIDQKTGMLKQQNQLTTKAATNTPSNFGQSTWSTRMQPQGLIQSKSGGQIKALKPDQIIFDEPEK